MKKRWILRFSLLYALLLTACAAAEPSVSQVESETDIEALNLSLETSFYSEDYEKDGVLLATLRLSYPKLVVTAEDGEEYIGPETETVDGVTRYLDEVRIAKNFNAHMEAEITARQEEFNALCSDAQSHYAQLDEEQKKYWGNYALEVNHTSFQSENLISTVATGYWMAGGAHPTSFYETWNFDLLTGEFFTLTDLSNDGAAIHRAVADEVACQVNTRRLDQVYFEDYESIVRDLAYTHLSFDEKGLTVRFDLYTLAPYAMGVPEFFVGYEVFCDYLSKHAREVLPVPEEAYILAAFYEAQELWSYFHMTTIPLDYDAPAIEQNGVLYYPVDYAGITTLDALKEYLCEYVTEEIAEEWLCWILDRFVEFNGVLYCFEADRGSDLRYGEPRYEVALLIDHGSVTATMDTYDTTKIDPVTGEMPIVGERNLYYHFTMVNGRPIFEHFPSVW